MQAALIALTLIDLATYEFVVLSGRMAQWPAITGITICVLICALLALAINTISALAD